MKIKALSLTNFKGFKQVSFDFDGKNILISGINGCGKSSVLQAIHWAARAASYVLPKNTKEMISFERLDYVPSSEPLTTLHNGELKTDARSTPVEIVFTHRSTIVFKIISSVCSFITSSASNMPFLLTLSGNMARTFSSSIVRFFISIVLQSLSSVQ